MKRIMLFLFIYILMFFHIANAYGDEALSPVGPTNILGQLGSDTSPDDKNEAKPDEPKKGTNEKDSNNGSKQFYGLTLGVGLSLTHDLGKHDRVKSASVVNGVVRVESEANDIVRIMLETHYFFHPKDTLWGVERNRWGYGPFVSIQPGSDELINAIAFGFMVGIKQSEDITDKSSWNIGFGAIVDPSVQILGDGLVTNQPLPAGETEVRYQTKSQWGVLVITSFNF